MPPPDFDPARVRAAVQELAAAVRGQPGTVRFDPPTPDEPLAATADRVGLLRLGLELAEAAFDDKTTVCLDHAGRAVPDLGSTAAVEFRMTDSTPHEQVADTSPDGAALVISFVCTVGVSVVLVGLMVVGAITVSRWLLG